jgi:predicted nucleic acid-binding protein
MAARRRAAAGGAEALSTHRFTVDASVFVNAFNPHEPGQAASLAFLTAVQQQSDPVIVPTLLLVEVASAVARATGDTEGAHAYAQSIAALPQVSVIPLTTALARQGAQLAATHRLRGADAVYVAVARRYGTVLVTRDREQRTRGAAVVTCRTPETAFRE